MMHGVLVCWACKHERDVSESDAKVMQEYAMMQVRMEFWQECAMPARVMQE
jgi:hypothetical protein